MDANGVVSAQLKHQVFVSTQQLHTKTDKIKTLQSNGMNITMSTKQDTVDKSFQSQVSEEMIQQNQFKTSSELNAKALISSIKNQLKNKKQYQSLFQNKKNKTTMMMNSHK